jgi:hypothetical protein
MENSRPSDRFYFYFCLSFFIGMILRLYILQDQILLDDEWHSLDYVPGKSLYYLLTHWGISANTIPLNLYHFWMLQTTGWSEWLFRIPSLGAGILSLIFFPILLRGIIGDRPAGIFALLLAVSPLLIFYHRISRGYGAVSFLVFFSILCLYLWLTRGQFRYGVYYVLSGALAFYFHLFALVGVLSPFGFILLYRMRSRPADNDEHMHPTVPHLVVIVLSLFLLIGILMIPPFLQSPFPMVPEALDRANLKSLIGVISLVSGTENVLLMLVYLGLSIFGFILLWKQRKLFAGMLFFVFFFNFLAVITVNHPGIHIPLEISRFTICIFPISYVWVSSGINHLLTVIRLPSIIPVSICKDVLSILFIALFFIKGPLPATYDSPNNFTHHSAFQESYNQLKWEVSYDSHVASGYFINKTDVPPFYFQLSTQQQVKKIIEYPMYIGNHFNFYYYYQHFHKKNITAGYFTSITWLDSSRGCIFGNYYLDFPLSRISDKSKLKFTNMVDMENINDVKTTGAQYIILHKNLLHEMSHFPVQEGFSDNPPDLFQNDVYIPVIHLNLLYRKHFGSPVFEDPDLIVFKL